MGMFDNIFGGNSGSQSAPKGIKKIEQFCSRIGWAIAERSDRVLSIPFATPIGQRHLILAVNSTGEVGFAKVGSGYERRLQQLQSVIGLYFLMRSNDMSIGGWKAEKSGDEASFFVWHTFVVEGLTLPIFKSMCDTLVEEVGSAITEAHSKGWL